MTALKTDKWRKLPLSLTELCIETTLRCGQSFRWRKLSDEWHCTHYGRIVSLKQDAEHLYYRVTWPRDADVLQTASAFSTEGSKRKKPPIDDTEALLENYFNLHHDLVELYKKWAVADPNFRKRAPRFAGVRILNQDAWETLMGFICSSNNNISRISKMVDKLCLNYGPYIGHVAGEAFHDVPSPKALGAPGVEGHLRELGFGYRAKYICETARNIYKERPDGWLQGLRNPESIAWASKGLGRPCVEQPSYKSTHKQLLQLSGVGPKVADCVCLMGLGWAEAVPVDTHVWQIAMRDYNFGEKSKNKTLTKAMYDSVGDHFRDLWGNQAGWAHSVLFTADLRIFSDRVAEKALKESNTGSEAVKVQTKDSSSMLAAVATPFAKTKQAVSVGVVKLEVDEASTPVARRRSKRRRT